MTHYPTGRIPNPRCSYEKAAMKCWEVLETRFESRLLMGPVVIRNDVGSWSGIDAGVDPI